MYLILVLMEDIDDIDHGRPDVVDHEATSGYWLLADFLIRAQ